MTHIHWVAWQNKLEIPRDKDEVSIKQKNLLFIIIDKAWANDKTYIWVSVWWKTKNENWGIYAPRIHWVPRGTGTPIDRDEVNRRDVCECDGWVCVLYVIGAPSIFKLIRKAAALARVCRLFLLAGQRTPRGGSGKVHCLVAQAELLKLQKSGQFPDEPVRIKVWQIHYVTSQTY